MASYDTYGTESYVVEAGTYGISLWTDSHTVVDEKEYEVAEDIVYDEYEDYTGSVTPAWMMLTYGIDAVLAVILIGIEALIIMRYKKKMKNQTAK